MKLLVFIFSTLISFSALANFTGTWKGQGTLDDSEGNTVACKAMSFEFNHTDTQFELKSGDLDCELFKMQWAPVSFAVQDGDLLVNGDRVGTIADDFIFAHQKDATKGLHSILQIEMTDQGLVYKETSSDDQGNILFSVEGILTK
jgi:hypothetical protein